MLGFIDAIGVLTDTGELLLQCKQGDSTETNLWRQAVIAMRVEENGKVSHPMRILLRILAERGPLPRQELALALEAEDDGEAEFERVLGLIPIEVARARGALDVTQAVLANAVKVLPPLALHLGLASKRGKDLVISEEGSALCNAAFQFGDIVPLAATSRRQRARGESPRRAANVREIVPGEEPPPFDPAAFVARSPEEQVETIRVLHERTKRHEGVVQQLAAAFRDRFEAYEDRASFDALLVPKECRSGPHLLEVKTLDLDEVDQTNRAVAQLFWYRWAKFPEAERSRLSLGVVYDEKPTEDTCSYLQDLGIGAFVCCERRIEACNDAALSLCPEPLSV
jgi:hypothetical protein